MKRKRRVIIAHGWNDGGNNAWINWLASTLTSQGYEVVQPIFPHIHVPRTKDWVAALREAAGTLDSKTVLVGYSLGVPTVLRYLNDYPRHTQIAGLVLVAGFGDGLLGRPAALFDPPLDFDQLRHRAAHRVCIYANNDYLIAPRRSQELASGLGAREVIIMGKGHLVGLSRVPGSVAELPAVLAAVEESFRLTPSRAWQYLVQSVVRYTPGLMKRRPDNEL